jgi:hypothetical protein
VLGGSQFRQGRNLPILVSDISYRTLVNLLDAWSHILLTWMLVPEDNNTRRR